MIRLSYEEKSSERQQQKVTFDCSCGQSWPLASEAAIDSISQHLSRGGTAPLVKATRTDFSGFFQYFSFKVSLLILSKLSTTDN